MGLVESTITTDLTFEKISTTFKSWWGISDNWLTTQLCGYILMNTAELEFLYPTPQFAEIAISAWANINAVRFNELYKTVTVDFYQSFEPLENYNMTETTTQNDVNSGTDKHSHGGGTKTTETTTLKDSGTVADSGNASRNGSTTHKVSAFNATSLADAHSDTDTYNTTSTNTRTDDLTHSTNSEHNFTDTQTLTITKNDTLNRDISVSRHGNIGVTSSQQLAQSQRELIIFNFNTFILNEFKKEFCLLVY